MLINEPMETLAALRRKFQTCALSIVLTMSLRKLS
jgi:hypothetical protein